MVINVQKNRKTYRKFNNGFQIMFQAPSKRILEANKSLFYRLANSVVFPDQYR